MKNITIAALTMTTIAAIYIIAALAAILTTQGENLSYAHEYREHLKCVIRTIQIEAVEAVAVADELYAELGTVKAQAERYAIRYRRTMAELQLISRQNNFHKDVIALGNNGVTADLSDLRIPSGASEAQINTLLENTPIYGLGWYFLAAEREYGVNAIIMISIMRQESGIATTGSLWRQNNFAGITNGRGGWARFETPQDGIFALARLLGTHYLCYDGRFHRGVSLEAVNILYAPLSDPLNRGWAPGIRSHTVQFLERLEY